MGYKKVAFSARWSAFANLTLSPNCLHYHTRSTSWTILFCCLLRWRGCCEVDCFGKVRAPAVGVKWPIPVSHSSNHPIYALCGWFISNDETNLRSLKLAMVCVTWTRNISLLTFLHFMAFVVVGWMRRSLVCNNSSLPGLWCVDYILKSETYISSRNALWITYEFHLESFRKIFTFTTRIATSTLRFLIWIHECPHVILIFLIVWLNP